MYVHMLGGRGKDVWKKAISVTMKLLESLVAKQGVCPWESTEINKTWDCVKVSDN